MTSNKINMRSIDKGLFHYIRSYLSPYNIITGFLTYISNVRPTVPLMVENTSFELKDNKSIEDEEFQMILPSEEQELQKIKFEPNTFIPIINYDYIDEAIEKYPYNEMIIKRFPDYGFMSVYMMQVLPNDKIDRLLISIYVRRCEDRILIEYQGRQYEWYWFGNNFIRHRNLNVIYGPYVSQGEETRLKADMDILNHFKERPDYKYMETC